MFHSKLEYGKNTALIKLEHFNLNQISTLNQNIYKKEQILHRLTKNIASIISVCKYIGQKCKHSDTVRY